MRIAKGFVIRDVGGKKYAVATGDAAKLFKGMLTVNDTGELIFNLLKEDTTQDIIVDKIVAEYEVDRSVVEKDVSDFISQLREINVILD